jgi:hypothetical protein
VTDAQHAIDVLAAEACPWQDCQHDRCTSVRTAAERERARLGPVRDPRLITLREANIAVQSIFDRARRGESIKDAVTEIVARIQHAIDNGAWDSVALAREIEFARQAAEGRV